VKLLDLYCKAGGAAMGYWRAGFHDITGVDHEPQKNYPFDFHQADVFEWCAEHDLSQYDLIHASPPCQKYSQATPEHCRQNHPDYIGKTRELLKATGRPYVIENVQYAPMGNAVMLCGSMFGLKIWRHRFFECCPEIFLSPAACNHAFRPVLITGQGQRKIKGRREPKPLVKEKRKAIEIPWMTGAEITEAIPPAYTEWIGKQLIEQLEVEDDYEL